MTSLWILIRCWEALNMAIVYKQTKPNTLCNGDGSSGVAKHHQVSSVVTKRQHIMIQGKIRITSAKKQIVQKLINAKVQLMMRTTAMPTVQQFWHQNK